MKKPLREPYVRIAWELLAFGMSERKMASCLKVPQTTLRRALAKHRAARAALLSRRRRGRS